MTKNLMNCLFRKKPPQIRLKFPKPILPLPFCSHRADESAPNSAYDCGNYKLLTERDHYSISSFETFFFLGLKQLFCKIRHFKDEKEPGPS